jgi:biotin operon repressor
MELKHIIKTKEILKKSKGWMTGQEIRLKLATYTTGAEFREIINRLRQEGAPIIAGRRGYKFASTKEEISEQIKSMQGRINQMNKAIRGLKSNLN